MNFLKFLLSKVFLKNLALAICITVVLVFAVFKFFDIYTHHGEAISVPDFSGLNYDEMVSMNVHQDFVFILSDSLYDQSQNPGSVVDQNPRPHSQVKKGRKIYFTVVAKNPEMVEMPDLVDLTLRQSLSILETYDLKVNKLEYVPDIAKNAVLQQLFNGEILEPGTKIIKGSGIDLVLGLGEGFQKVRMPFLYGLKLSEARKHILHSSLNLGAEYYFDTYDTSVLRVYDQYPACTTDTYTFMGDSVKLWLRSELEYDFPEFLKSFQPDTIATDSLRILDSLMLLEDTGFNPVHERE
ncbi:MAG: PASTA domain-containing protein [Bacteroidales bacterium]|nr:PASTA domain-containing protein [Bacteroidales bacterium]